MTLIAGFRSAGIPILLGDFLLSSVGVPSGLTRKVHLISPNFVVAWTGYLTTAAAVLGDLNSEFQNKQVEKCQVEEFLSKYETAKFGDLDVRLICWIAEDDNQYCFRWNSLYPGELFYADSHYDGSGEKIAEKISALGIMNMPERSGVPSAIDNCLKITTRLMSDEFLGGEHKKLGFGHAYEVLYLDGKQFKYLNNITYLAWEFHFDPEGTITRNQILSKAYLYRCLPDFSLVRELELQQRRTLTNIIRPVWQRRGTISREVYVADVFRANLEMKRRSSELQSEYYCMFLIFVTPDGELIPCQINLLNNAQNLPLRIETANGDAKVVVQLDVIKRIYKSILASRNKK